MSRSLYITCEDCKERLWVGQGSYTFYSGEKETMKALGKFLFEHEGHHLSFMDDNANDDWFNPKKGWKVWWVEDNGKIRKNNI